MKRIHELSNSGQDLETALASFSGDESVRIMSIHKSKGLEFDTVIVLGVEKETFWGKDQDAERSAFFVAISRAKHRLILTVAAEREEPAGAGFWKRMRNEQAEYIGYAEAYA